MFMFLVTCQVHTCRAHIAHWPGLHNVNCKLIRTKLSFIALSYSPVTPVITDNIQTSNCFQSPSIGDQSDQMRMGAQENKEDRDEGIGRELDYYATFAQNADFRQFVRKLSR